MGPPTVRPYVYKKNYLSFAFAGDNAVFGVPLQALLDADQRRAQQQCGVSAARRLRVPLFFQQVRTCRSQLVPLLVVVVARTSHMLLHITIAHYYYSTVTHCTRTHEIRALRGLPVLRSFTYSYLIYCIMFQKNLAFCVAPFVISWYYNREHMTGW